jgi:hypothetical protein
VPPITAAAIAFSRVSLLPEDWLTANSRAAAKIPPAAVAEVHPDRRARGAVERDQHRWAPALLAGGRPVAVHLGDQADAWRCETRLEMVERDRPVRRAISARLTGPPARRTPITRPRFCARNDSSEPTPGLDIPAPTSGSPPPTRAIRG